MKFENITVSLPTETIKLADEKHTQFGFQNRSEFINAAIREYLSRDILRQFSGGLVDIYEKIEHSEIKWSRHNFICCWHSTIELPDVADRNLRGKAVRMVTELKGFVPVSKAAQQAEFIPEIRTTDWLGERW